MLDARRVIIAVVAIAVISLAVTLIELTAPPDSGGRGRDSYGTRAHGMRALLELLEELGVSVERSLVPPDAYLDDHTTIVLWAPAERMVKIEPAHVTRIAEWVRGGGAVVVAPPSERSWSPPRGMRRGPIVTDTDVLTELGLEGVKVTLATGDAELEEDDDYDYGFSPKLKRQIFSGRRVRYQTLGARVDGAFAHLRGKVLNLSVPVEEFRHIELDARAEDVPRPAGRVLVTGVDGGDHLLAAIFDVGEGTVCVFSEPRVFHNRAIAEADNAVLAAHAVARGGTAVVLDEFYHGLTVRGNPVWLLSRHPYGILTLLMLAATGVWAWRAGSRLGPAVAERPALRRDIGEYIDAMGMLFKRSGHRRFVLREVRDGVLWSLRKSLHLDPGHEDVKTIAKALERRDRERADRLRAAEQRVTSLIKSPREPRADRAIGAAKEITACL